MVFLSIFSLLTSLDMYNNDPISGLGLTAAEEELVLGGEAATWGESVDVISWDQRGLTRSPSVAERLWSAESVDDRNWLEVFHSTSLYADNKGSHR